MKEAAELIAELRAELLCASEGPWTIEMVGADYIVRIDGEYAMCDTTYYPSALDLSDAQYVVAAQPKNIRLLLDHIETLEARVATLSAALEPFADAARKYGQKCLDRRAENNLPHDYAAAVFASAEQTGWNPWANAVTAYDAAREASR